MTSHGATNETTLAFAFDAWDATVDFEFSEVEEDAGEVGKFVLRLQIRVAVPRPLRMLQGIMQ